jgi:hypothetical protein
MNPWTSSAGQAQHASDVVYLPSKTSITHISRSAGGSSAVATLTVQDSPKQAAQVAALNAIAAAVAALYAQHSPTHAAQVAALIN